MLGKLLITQNMSQDQFQDAATKIALTGKLDIAQLSAEKLLHLLAVQPLMRQFLKQNDHNTIRQSPPQELLPLFVQQFASVFSYARENIGLRLGVGSLMSMIAECCQMIHMFAQHGHDHMSSPSAVPSMSC